MPWMDEAALDDPAALEALDRQDSLRSLATAGAQVRRAQVSVAESGMDALDPRDRPRSVLVAAVGGSAVVADVLDLLAEPHSPVPVTTRPGGPLPGWIGPLDLVIAVSQSGRARGPLALAQEAARRGAQLLTIGAAGSPLADVSARAHGIHVEMATAAPSTRTALWSLLTPVLCAADRLGIASCDAAVLEEVASVLEARAEECRPSSEAFVNPGKDLALAFSDVVPVVLADGPLTGVAARRLASGLARTARIPAIHGMLPDGAAEVVACFDGPLATRGTGMAPMAGADIFADPYLDGPAALPLALFLLRDAQPEPGRLTAADVERINLASAVAESARESGVRVREIEAPAGSGPARLASLLALVDYAATYAALALGFDPIDSPHVQDLRRRTG